MQGHVGTQLPLPLSCRPGPPLPAPVRDPSWTRARGAFLEHAGRGTYPPAPSTFSLRFFLCSSPTKGFFFRNGEDKARERFSNPSPRPPLSSAGGIQLLLRGSAGLGARKAIPWGGGGGGRRMYELSVKRGVSGVRRRVAARVGVQGGGCASGEECRGIWREVQVDSVGA
uniref:Uncharacterized protein n=1 Tax=Physcomitrium patens TaxID=3218 RepID=A0A7I4EB75_PHYPA